MERTTRTLVTCTDHPSCQFELETGTHHPADPQPDSPAEVALRTREAELAAVMEEKEDHPDLNYFIVPQKHSALQRFRRRHDWVEVGAVLAVIDLGLWLWHH
jgi:hypothetical protein